MATVRSVLCVPGHDAHKVERCRDWGADLILFDLEDAVPEAHKAAALEAVCAAVRPDDAVRVCGITHPARDAQLRALDGRVNTVWLPKVRGPHALRGAGWGGDLWALIECPTGILNAAAIAAEAHGVAFGRWDFMAATGIADAWAPLVEHAMGQVALAAHAAGIPASDAPCYVLDGGYQMAAEVRRAKGYGYVSKGCVHPKQIPYCAGLGPSLHELSSAAQATVVLGASRSGNLLQGPPMARLGERLRAEANA